MTYLREDEIAPLRRSRKQYPGSSRESDLDTIGGLISSFGKQSKLGEDITETLVVVSRQNSQ